MLSFPGYAPEALTRLVAEIGNLFSETLLGLRTAKEGFGKKGLSKRKAPAEAFFSHQIRALPLQKINSVVWRLFSRAEFIKTHAKEEQEIQTTLMGVSGTNSPDAGEMRSCRSSSPEASPEWREP